MDAIKIEKLSKNFGKTKALNELTMSVSTGEVHGFLGPNGSGKSTTMRVLLGLLKKGGGKVSVLGKDPWKDAVDLHKRLAYIPGEVNLWPNLTGGEAIDLLGKLRGGINQKRREELMQKFDLDPTKKFRTYSKGNRQKVAIISALSSDVDLYLFDEPTSGLDPLLEKTFQDYVLEIKASDKTVLLSSHILAEVEKLCDRVSIIREGTIVESGTLSELRHLTRTSISAITGKPAIGLEKLAGIHAVKTKENLIEFEVDNSNINTALEYLIRFDIRDLTSNPPTLEDLFMRHYTNDSKK